LFPELIPESSYLSWMADGTIKQVNPFTGTEVWTVPERADRPLGVLPIVGKPLEPHHHDDYCAFCSHKYTETPPEKARLVRTADGHQTIRDVAAENLFDAVAEFRRVPNLFEIVSFDYWKKNFGYVPPESVLARQQAYLSTDAGRNHVLGVIEQRMRFAGMTDDAIRATPVEEKLEDADAFFGGGHELIIARRHFLEGARFDNELASSGTLTPDEHYQYMRFTIDAVRDLFVSNRYVRYVSVFQNWLRPAGASFDHLHKQICAIDERGQQNEHELRLARLNPNIYNEAAVNYAAHRNLVFAENDHAIAFAGFGHRFPTLEVYSKSPRTSPWNHRREELRAMSDLIHACHAASGPTIPCNEEWYYRPPDADVRMPWRVLIKWRISNPAGFEGGTRIFVNSIDPVSLRDRVVPKLFKLKDEGRIAPMKIAFECDCVPNCLKYNPAVREKPGQEPEFPSLSDRSRKP